MKKNVPTLAALLLLALGSASVASAQTCKPVTGHFKAHIVAPGQGNCPDVPGTFCTAGQVWGGIQGNYEFVMTGAVPSGTIGGVPTILFFTGQSRVNLLNGNLLLGTDTGSLDLPPGQGGFASLITFAPGAGSTATGQIRLRGEFDAVQATTSGDYDGSVCAD